jgi:hypothetical protein
MSVCAHKQLATLSNTADAIQEYILEILLISNNVTTPHSSQNNTDWLAAFWGVRQVVSLSAGNLTM